MSVRFSSVQHLFEKELRVSALQLCVMDAPQLGCFLIGCSVPRLRCGGITKLWFEVSLGGSVLCTPVHLLIFHHGSPGGYVPLFLC